MTNPGTSATVTTRPAGAPTKRRQNAEDRGDDNHAPAQPVEGVHVLGVDACAALDDIVVAEVERDLGVRASLRIDDDPELVLDGLDELHLEVRGPPVMRIFSSFA